MLNKIYEWIETSFTTFRDGEPAVEEPHAHGDTNDEQMKGKRSRECLENDFYNDQDEVAVKRSRFVDLMDTVKNAAEGVKSHSTHVATWMKKSVSPTWSSFVSGTSETLVEDPQPSTSANICPDRPMNADADFSDDETFVAPSTNLEWRISKSDWSRPEKSGRGSKVCRRQVGLSHSHREVPKTNGHSVNMSPFTTSEFQLSPRLGRPLNFKPHRISRMSDGDGPLRSSCTTMYEKSFPIKVVQSPTHSSSSSRSQKLRQSYTAQESVREEEKEIYRQLLNMVSGGHSSLSNGSSHTIVRSQRDFTSFLSSRRLIQSSSPVGSAEEGTSEGQSSRFSPRRQLSQCSSNLPSPIPDSTKLGLDGPDTYFNSSMVAAPALSPSILQDNTSQDTQSSAHDSDSVIIIAEQKGQKTESSRLSFFQAELWIKELTSMYDSRARERRRQIEEQKMVAAKLLKQRLFEESQHSSDVDVRVRVPLEKEVPLTFVIEEPKDLKEIPEFPELTQQMESEVNVALRGGNPHEVISEGFGLYLTRKDLQTLSNLNWLNDEVINFYMNLLVERSEKTSLPSVNTFNTFFYPKLRSSGFTAVRRWTKKMDIFAKDILLVPVHLGMHWCLIVVDFRKKSISYFDSMGGSNDNGCEMLLDYLKKESSDKKGRELDTSGWTLQSKKPSEIPQQMNGSDCGMFTCKYADYITKDKPITFSQKHMPYFRKRMIWEIVKHKLL